MKKTKIFLVFKDCDRYPVEAFRDKIEAENCIDKLAKEDFNLDYDHQIITPVDRLNLLEYYRDGYQIIYIDLK